MQSQENFNMVVSKNLTTYRKLNNLTQLDLAEKLNYSDKAISKWERGECLPDAYTLYQIATLYGISVNDLFASETNIKPIKANKKFKPFFITLLSSCLVWLVATVLFVLLTMIFPNMPNLWFTFIVAIPVNFIVLIVFTSVYHSKIGQFISVSGLVWTAILTLDLFLKQVIGQTALLYFIGIPLQVAVIFWYALKWYLKRKKV
jgi:transcriptional regulator with XRE-family HTH domain